MTQHVLLSLPEPIYNKLKAQLRLYAYTSVQEVIIDALREKYFRQSRVTGGKRGRPRKINELRLLGRKRAFGKRGVAVEY